MGENRLIGIKEILEMTSLTTATIYRLIKQGKFPPGRLITPNRRVWRLGDAQKGCPEAMG